jgi:hypothetical protein
MEVSGLLEELELLQRQATAITDNTKKVGSQQNRQLLLTISGNNTGDQSLSALGGVESNDAITAATSTKNHI